MPQGPFDDTQDQMPCRYLQGIIDLVGPIVEKLAKINCNPMCMSRATFETDDDSADNEGASSDVSQPRREIFFFADGSVIFWSVPELEREMILRLLRDPNITVGPYDQDTVFEESELMTFKLDASSQGGRTHLDSKVRDFLSMNRLYR